MKKRTVGIIERLRQRSRTWAILCLIACAPLIKGCYGSFPLTKAVYKFNSNAIPNKLGQEILFLVFIILPVYSIAMFGDAVVCNLIEFWTGETVQVSQTTLEDGTRLTLTPGTSPKEAILTVDRPDGTTRVVRFVRTADRRTTVYENGTEPVGYVVVEADGSIDFQNVKGRTMQVLTPRMIAALRLGSGTGSATR